MKIGNIIYSMLTPEQFRQQNGNGWVLLDGGEDMEKIGLDLKKTDLCLTHGICYRLQDARGCFIRTHDNRQNKKDRINRDRKLDSGIGSIQEDAFQGH